MDESGEIQDPVSESLDNLRKFMTRFIAVVTFMMLTFGLYVYFTRTNDQKSQKKLEHTVSRLDDTQKEIIQTRNESRKIQCEKENEFKIDHNNGFQHVVDVFQGIADKTQNPDVQSAAKKQLEIFKSDLVELRDCSSEGIEKYYANGGD